MANPAPKLDQRTAPEIARQLRELLAIYAPNWKEFDLQTGKPTGASAALIGIFGRFAELIIHRLNQAPAKNFLAFLDLIGASLLPPQPARVPLTFSLAAGSSVDGVVPAGTQVAAPPAEGEAEPVIFETERELVVIAAQLVSVYVRDPDRDQYANHSSMIGATSSAWVPVFQGERAIEHMFYVGDDALFRYPLLETLTLTIDLEKNIEEPRDPRILRWEIWDGEQGIPLDPTSDTTSNLTQSGDIVFSSVPAVPEQTVASRTSRWLRCRLLTPITHAARAQADRVHASQLPTINRVSLRVGLNRTRLPIEAAFANQIAVDLSKDFFPFGEKPKFGDALYLAQREAFSQAGAAIILDLSLTAKDSGIPAPKADGGIELIWEFWNGATWQMIGSSSAKDGGSPAGFDTTRAFTQPTGMVAFKLPQAPAQTTVNGIENYWIRARISGGNYGEEARYELINKNKAEDGYKLIPANFAPPSLATVVAGYQLTAPPTGAPAALPDHILTYNDLAYQAPAMPPLIPFRPTTDTRPSLYLGFTLPPERPSFPNRTVSLYFRMAEEVYGGVPDNPSPASSPRLAWRYWNGQAWTDLTARDETQGLTRSGLVEFLPPGDFSKRAEFGLDPEYWLLLSWESGDYKFLPNIRQVFVNTTWAGQTVTVKDEILGSSDGSENQKFHTVHASILAGPQLEVREPEMPPAAEQEIILREEGDGAIRTVLDGTGRPKEIWVRWHGGPDFYGSAPRDRHYVLDHLTGEIGFGDGISGLIPPVGIGNLRLARYRTGGGSAGNRPAETIIQLQTTVPYVDKVTNFEAATGGADAETLDSLLARAPRMIRHRERAVTLEDYEDLAILASPAVARAKCVPLYDLEGSPVPTQREAGAVSVIVVPRSTAPKPLPSLELLSRVRDYLDARRLPNADLFVVGPHYLRVDVDTEVALVSLQGAGEVEAAIFQTLAGFLHPLTGGLDGAGWHFGRRPHKSDVYALIEAIPGVDHVRTLKVDETEDQAGVSQTDRFMVYSGTHRISLTFEQP